MSGEQTFWAYVRKGMRGRWHVQRHEDSVTRGIPDVSYAIDGAEGWIELKTLNDWPKRPTTPVRVDIKPEQVAWLEARGDAGAGRCFVLIRVGHEHLLVRWNRVRDLLRDDLSVDDVRDLAEHRWERGIDWDDLIGRLITRYPFRITGRHIKRKSHE